MLTSTRASDVSSFFTFSNCLVTVPCGIECSESSDDCEGGDSCDDCEGGGSCDDGGTVGGNLVGGRDAALADRSTLYMRRVRKL